MVCRGGRLIGFFALRDKASHLYVTTIQLVPEERGAGIGSALMHHFEHFASQRGFQSIRLRVLKGNRAATFYRRLGYRILEDGTHVTLMEKSLDAPRQS